MDSRSPRKLWRQSLDGLAGFLAYDSACVFSRDCSDRDRPSDRLLDNLLTLAMEISSRSSCGAADRPASNRARILSAVCAWPSQPTRPLVASADRAHARVHF